MFINVFKRGLVFQACIITIGILLLSRPNADGMQAIYAEQSDASADRIAAEYIPTNSPSDDTDSSVPEVDLSGIDWTALARHVYGKCGEYHDLAIAIGWPAEEWPTLSMVMNRESRCNPNAFNGTDPNGGSRGLVQINGFWCRPNRYTPNGFLQDKGALSVCDDLYNPEVNLRSALHMWLYGENRGGCGWRPWATRCN